MLLVEVDFKPAITEMHYFDSVNSARLDNQNMISILNYQIMFNVTFIGLSPWYHKTDKLQSRDLINECVKVVIKTLEMK